MTGTAYEGALPPQAGINMDRLRDDLTALARIGMAQGQPGANRPSFSEADMAGRRWLLSRMEEAGLNAHLDAAGNVVGRWEVGHGPAVLMGSHLDTVPNGGLLDGALGVLAGLECVRALQDHGVAPPCPLEVIGTSEEEGRFGGMLGSQALTGTVDPDWLNAASDEEGNLLVDCMAAHGLDPVGALRLRRDPSGIRAFLELHVEQGPVLESRGLPVGIVTGISGVFHWSITLRGQANHAGTTPMAMRRDPILAMAEFVDGIHAMIIKSRGVDGRLTVGKIDVTPGFPHTVPESVTFSLVGKDLDDGVMDRLAGICRDALDDCAERHGVDCQVDVVSQLNGQPCHPDVIAAIARQAERLGIATHAMPSGAGHDAQIMAGHVPSGMIFVPSIGGISHAPEEATDWSDIEIGANLLLHTCLDLSERG